MRPFFQASINRMKSSTESPTRTVSARAIFFESPLPRDRWNSALPRLITIANNVTMMRTLITSMGTHSILPAPMPARFSAFGRVFAPSWPITLVTLALVVLFVRLGIWQWHRGEEKQVAWSEFERNGAAQDVATRDLDTVTRFTHARLHGEFAPAHQFLLDNRSHDGLPGYEVLTPFVLDSGSTVLVNRGWVPFTGYRDRLPDISLQASGAMTITGRIDELPAAGLAAGRAAPEAGATWPKLTSFPTPEELASTLGKPLPRRIVLLDANAPGGYVRVWSPPGLPPSRHFSYAIQWWGFAIALLVLYFGLNFRKVS